MTAAVILIDLQKDFFRTEYKDQALADRVAGSGPKYQPAAGRVARMPYTRVPSGDFI